MIRRPPTRTELAAAFAKTERLSEAARLLLAETIEGSRFSRAMRSALEAVHREICAEQAGLRAMIAQDEADRDTTTRDAARDRAVASASRLRARIAEFAIPAAPGAGKAQGE